MAHNLQDARAAADAAVQTGDVPGVVTLIWQGGRILDVHAAGVADGSSGRRMTRDAIFPIASMSKPVTVVAALRLLEQGTLRLEDPITKWAPEFADMRVLKLPGAPLDDTYPAPRRITIEDLMTHRSGLTYGFTSSGPLGGALMQALGFGIESSLSPHAWMQALAALPLAAAPGERFEYGHSIDVLGFILGRAAGTTFQEVLRREVLDPLGMKDTGFWVPPEKRERFVANTMSAAPGEFLPASIAAFIAPEASDFASGGQGLVSTADDYLAFASMLAGGGETQGVRLLKPDTVQLMATNRLTSAQRRMPFFGMPFFASNGFGLGVSVVMDAEKHAAMGAASVGAFGWPGGFGGWWQADPAKQLVLIWLQACVPTPPQVGPPPRLPGAAAVVEFQRRSYAALGG